MPRTRWFVNANFASAGFRGGLSHTQTDAFTEPYATHAQRSGGQTVVGVAVVVAEKAVVVRIVVIPVVVVRTHHIDRDGQQESHDADHDAGDRQTAAAPAGPFGLPQTENAENQSDNGREERDDEAGDGPAAPLGLGLAEAAVWIVRLVVLLVERTVTVVRALLVVWVVVRILLIVGPLLVVAVLALLTILAAVLAVLVVILAVLVLIAILAVLVAGTVLLVADGLPVHLSVVVVGVVARIPTTRRVARILRVIRHARLLPIIIRRARKQHSSTAVPADNLPLLNCFRC